MVVIDAKKETGSAAQTVSLRDTQTSKDDIIHLIHLFKEPSTQKHWTNFHGVMKRADLDSRKSPAAYAAASNPLCFLVEMFNDYDEFCLQTLMVQYTSGGINLPPVKKQPYQSSGTEWSYLSNFTHDLEPTNLLRRNIVRGEDWIKSMWTDCRKYLHQMFINYNRSRQHDDDMDQWGSEKELQRWSRAATWKPTGIGSIIRYTGAMMYSIAVLDLCDFEAIGCKMPKGAGIDATMDTSALEPVHKRKKHKVSDRKKMQIVVFYRSCN
jgi:hypothetical protein